MQEPILVCKIILTMHMVRGLQPVDPSQEKLINALNRIMLSTGKKRAIWNDYSDLYGWKMPSPW